MHFMDLRDRGIKTDDIGTNYKGANKSPVCVSVVYATKLPLHREVEGLISLCQAGCGLAGLTHLASACSG